MTTADDSPLDLKTASNEELHHEWWVRARVCTEQQTVTCGCAVDEKVPKERCDRCRSFADARDDVERELRRRGEWTTGSAPKHPLVYSAPPSMTIPTSERADGY